MLPDDAAGAIHMRDTIGLLAEIEEQTRGVPAH
jgi:hypothetical protein